MRLLHTERLEFQEFFDDQIPEYSILSHRWSNLEVSYEQFLLGQHKDGHGYKKIVELCRISRESGWAWTWIDTCCIDKRSSSELSEAINSMYHWYANSQICYVFLPDVAVYEPSSTALYDPKNAPDDADEVAQYYSNDRVECPAGLVYSKSQLQKSDYFKRGWTLQELIAPLRLVFFDVSYRAFGTRQQLSNILRQITGIELFGGQDSENHPFQDLPMDELRDVTIDRVLRQRIVQKIPFATKMSWMATRTTSRKEDLSYCMLGLLGVNMPLLYGEGQEKAFKRLQTEYIVQTEDDSMFVWNRSLNGQQLLAARPFDFADSPVLCERRLASVAPHKAAKHPRGIELDLPVPLVALHCSEDWYAHEFDALYEIGSIVNAPDRTELSRCTRARPVFLGLRLGLKDGNTMAGYFRARWTLPPSFKPNPTTSLWYEEPGSSYRRFRSIFIDGQILENDGALFIFRSVENLWGRQLVPMTPMQKAKACGETRWWKLHRFMSNKVVNMQVVFRQDQ